jgi:hypothetical protein
VGELLGKLSRRSGNTGERTQNSGQVFRRTAAVTIAALKQKPGNSATQGADDVQRKSKGLKKLEGGAHRRAAGPGSIDWTVKRGISESRAGTTGSMMERDRLSGGKEQGEAQRLPDGVLSRYEESVRSAGIKTNHQNLKNADGNFNEIVRQFNILVKNGGGEARMVLEPEHLGHLRLRIQLDRGEVTTNMVVDNQAVKELILSRLNILEESLLKHGFGLGSFEVGVKGENADGDQASAKAQGRKVLPAVNLQEDAGAAAGVQEQYLPWISSRVNVTV